MERTNFERFTEPDEQKSFGFDYEGIEILEGDEYFEMENGKVQVDDIEKYARKYFETKVAEL